MSHLPRGMCIVATYRKLLFHKTNWLGPLRKGWFEVLEAPDALTWSETLLCLAASFLCPLVIGMERSFRLKPIDFRPYVIISLTACALLISTQDVMYASTGSFDPTRVMSGVITGIGFLGAGAMFRVGDYVKGAGTAASIWSAGAIGLICGLGEIWLAIILTGAVLILMLLSAPFTAEWDNQTDVDDIEK